MILKVGNFPRLSFFFPIDRISTHLSATFAAIQFCTYLATNTAVLLCAAVRPELARAPVDIWRGPECCRRTRSAPLLGSALHRPDRIRQSEPRPRAVRHGGAAVTAVRHTSLLQHSQER